LQHVGRNCCHFFPDVLFQIHRCPRFLFVHLALEISSEEEVLRLGTLVPKNIEVPTKYPLSQDRIVFEIRLHSKNPMLYRPALHGISNALRLARRALKDKFPKPKVLLTTVFQNRQVFLRDPIWILWCKAPLFSGTQCNVCTQCKMPNSARFWQQIVPCVTHSLLKFWSSASFTGHLILAPKG
jgi:hypothetical protein